MKIESVYPFVSFIIQTDNSEYFTYQRSSSNDWNVLMGESWEAIFNESTLRDLEKLYQEFIKDDDELKWYNDINLQELYRRLTNIKPMLPRSQNDENL
jgi:hypothetical protein